MENSLSHSFVGQDMIKPKLDFFLKGFENSSIFPHCLFIAPKGVGKTHIARIIGQKLKAVAKEQGIDKPFIEVNSSSITSVKAFVEQLYMNYIHDKHCTLFFDEVHELKDKIIAALLTILNPSINNFNTFRYGEMNLDFDFSRFTFLCATTEKQKLFAPFADRLTEVTLVDYTQEQLATIMGMNLFKGYSSSEEGLHAMAYYCRGNARDASKLGGKEGISAYLSAHNITHFEEHHVEELVNILGAFPLGLSQFEVSILKKINDEGSISLTKISSMSSMSKQSQQNIEGYLLKHGLIEIGQSHKREITIKGQKYVKDLVVKGRI
jgi:Holliday junction resolvasome RuvABC ATP-dependent DNA helicase subunit